MIAPDLLDLLRCPETMQPLRAASPELLERLQVDDALVREDGLVAYPVCDGIPVLLPEAGIALAAL